MSWVTAKEKRLDWKFKMGDWKCEKCGATNPPSSKHSCPHCGAPQAWESVIPMYRERGSKGEFKEYDK